MAPSIYTYNDKNQLIEATVSGATVTNTYNPEGLRATKTSGGMTTYYCYEYDQVIKEHSYTTVDCDIYELGAYKSHKIKACS